MNEIIATPDRTSDDTMTVDTTTVDTTTVDTTTVDTTTVDTTTVDTTSSDSTSSDVFRAGRPRRRRRWRPRSSGSRPGRAVRAMPVAVGTVAFGLIAASCASTTEASSDWCEAIGELDATLGSIGRPDPDTIRTALSELDVAATTIAERAPDDVRDAADRIERAIEAGAESGEPTLFEPTASSAMAEVHAFAADECVYERVAVVATDYAFSGIPDEVLAGKVALSFENRSELEDHEIVLFRKSDGVDEPMAELLALPEEEAMTKARSIAFTMAEPLGRSGLILDLEPGDYAAVCFVPVGGNEQGSPHFVHGMITDFVVG